MSNYWTDYVYIMTHVATGKKYVGRTRNTYLREKQHLLLLKSGKHPNKSMQMDYNKDPRMKFEVVGRMNSDRQRFDLEKQTMVAFCTYDERFGYNDRDIAMNPFRLLYGLPARRSSRWCRGEGLRIIGQLAEEVTT